ncbi:MAG: radical SAM protein [Fervidicoccaceae archaeon]
MWFSLRPDALVVWRDNRVRRALAWYYDVMSDAKPAKFLIAKYVEAPRDFAEMSFDELWKLHERLSAEFNKLWRRIRDSESLEGLERPETSFLDVKATLARAMLRSCRFCENLCGVDRSIGRRGVCGMGREAVVASYFHHVGEEAPLVPSGTIFYGGCTFKCVFCQNYDISQERPYYGEQANPSLLASIQRELRLSGARNINHVGGEPTPNLHVILASLTILETNVPQIWNSNYYMSLESVALLGEVIDLWLPDFKYWSDECAARLSGVERYREVVTRNLLMTVERGDMIIRHLVMPNHVECCTIPILEWVAKNLPRDKVIVNVMDQYRPEHLVLRYPEKYREIARRPSKEELRRAHEAAKALGLLCDVV